MRHIIGVFNKILSKIFKHKYLLSILFIGLIILIALNFQNIFTLNSKLSKLKNELMDVGKQLEELKNQDQVKTNQDLKKEIDNIQKTYTSAVSTYEKLLDFTANKSKKSEFEKDFAKSLKLLTEKNYASASAILAEVSKGIDEENQKAAASFTIPTNVAQNNTPPSSGFSAQKVSTDAGDFLVDIVSADLNSTKVIIDTASDSDCKDNCPVLSLADYVSRNGAYSGINGSFFCPQEYPSCTGKTNSFDTLLMNKNKHYFNSDNNVYSTVPAVIFSGNSIRFVGQSLEWGRDTSVDGVLANYPLLVSGGNIVYTEASNEPKFGNKGFRSFVAGKANLVYIGVIHNATMGESAKVLKSLGVSEALNLDEGGSTAFWSGSYKVGPGRNIPNALLLIRK